MVERPFFLDETYRLMTGSIPTTKMTLREIAAGIILSWDSALISSRSERQCAQWSLSCIGLDWHRSEAFPYTLEDVMVRLREIMPDVSPTQDMHQLMWDTLFPRTAVSPKK